MTYRELLKLYQEGKLDKAQTDEVEHAIEKQEAISEYLYEKEEIPGLEVLQGQEKEEVFVQGNDAESEEEQRFVKMIQKTIRRTFLKMGAIVGAGVLAIVLCVIFVLPQVVSAFYYNPNEVVGIGEGSDNITTTRMSLDLSVYSELFWPGSYRNTVNAVAEGYGTYNISIPQGISYDGKFTTVNGRLKRGKLTLYNTDEFKMPYGNTFMVPKEVEEYSRMHFFDEDTRQFCGPAGSEEEAYASIEKLDDNAYYIAYASLEKLTGYADFYNWAKNREMDAQLWCAVYTSDEDGYMCDSVPVGMLINPSGSCIDWDRETYPYLCQLDNRADTDSWHISEDTEKMETHFISLLSYLRDHPEIVKILNEYQEIPYDMMIESVKQDGLRIYGFSIVCQKEKLLQLRDEEEISYLYAAPLKKWILLIALLAAALSQAQAQGGRGFWHQEWTVEKGDSIPLVHVLPVYVFSRPVDLRRYRRLVDAVKKVYPIAQIAKAKMATMEEELCRLPTKKAQKEYIKQIYHEIKDEYTPVLKHMTRTQGRVLLKLIDRETEYTAYEVLKEFRGGFVAGFWQGVSKIFGQNLKSEYDREGEDRMIEQIVIYYEAGLLR